MNLTQTALAEKVGVSLSHYSQVEKGDRGISIETLDALLKALDLTILDVWIDDRERPPASLASVCIERTTGETLEKYTLPPSPETYRLLEMRLMPGENSDLAAIAAAWDDLDASTKNKILRLIEHHQ